MNFLKKDFFSKCDQTPSFLKKSLIKNFIFCPVGCICISPSNQFKSDGNQIEAEREVQEMCSNDECLSHANDINLHLR